MLATVLLILIAATVIAAAVYDAATLTIPNWISLVLLGLFPIAAVLGGLSWAEIGVHAGIGFGCLAFGIALFAAGFIGGGDAKLFAAIALFVGSGTFLPFVFFVTLAGGALACAILALGLLPYTGVLSYLPWLQRVVPGSQGIPYGVAIAAGALIALPNTQLFAQLSVY
jgi:prepilin peptidase CpaA